MSLEPTIFRVWFAPLTANEMLRMHFMERAAEKARWRSALRIAAKKLNGPRDGKPKRLQIVVFRAGLQDEDNKWASVKPVVDALMGSGWIADDRKSMLDLRVDEVKLKRKTKTMPAIKPYTMIYIEEWNKEPCQSQESSPTRS